jgi:peroxin-5
MMFLYLCLLKDYTLWNKLGVALVNSNRILEALDAYRKALEIQPNYIRAIYNLGIAYVSQKCYKEAAEHFLNALRRQTMLFQGRHGIIGEKKNEDQDLGTSSSIWMALRSLCEIMSRPDLVEKCDSRNLNGFSQEFQF